MRFAAVLVTLRGNVIASIPLRIILYVFIGSLPTKGGLKKNNRKQPIIKHSC